MATHHDDDYGRTFGDVYDDWYSLDFDDGAGAVEVLARYGRDGGALELGVGTGRIAIPLAARGISVHGVDTSPDMLRRLRAKPGAELVRTELADMTDCDLGRRFALVYSVFNSLFCVPDQRRQTACFAVAARHLAGPCGRFVVDHQIPDAVGSGSSVRHLHAGPDRFRFSVVHCDPVTQIMERQTMVVENGGVTPYRSVIRYVWPSEMDLMAAAAGLTLEDRWPGWQGGTVRPDTRRCISVYRPVTRGTS